MDKADQKRSEALNSYLGERPDCVWSDREGVILKRPLNGSAYFNLAIQSTTSSFRRQHPEERILKVTYAKFIAFPCQVNEYVNLWVYPAKENPTTEDAQRVWRTYLSYSWAASRAILNKQKSV